MSLKKLKMIFGISLLFSQSLLLSACAGNMKAPDVPVCVEFNPENGGCVKTVTGEKFEIDENHLFEGKTWWEHRPAMLLIPASSWVQIKSFIIKMCKKYNQCQSEVTSWDRTVEIIDSQVQQKIP